MILRRRMLGGLACLLSTGCARRRRVTVEPAEPRARVGSYVSSPWSFSTRSWWIEGEHGVVLIGTQFLASTAREAIAAAERATRKPVVMAFVLHPNPDKFNGTATLQAHGAQVLTSSQVLAQIPAVHTQRLAAFGERYAPDFPTQVPQPSTFGEHTTTVETEGLELRLHVMGAGCGTDHVVVQWRDHLFVGDLVANGAHAWTELGLLDAWLQRLDDLAALEPRWVHPGRGDAGGAELLREQARYLRFVQRVARDEVAALGVDSDPLDARAATRSAIVAAYPDYAFEPFVDVGLPAVLRAASEELEGHSQVGTPAPASGT